MPLRTFAMSILISLGANLSVSAYAAEWGLSQADLESTKTVSNCHARILYWAEEKFGSGDDVRRQQQLKSCLESSNLRVNDIHSRGDSRNAIGVEVEKAMAHEIPTDIGTEMGRVGVKCGEIASVKYNVIVFRGCTTNILK